VTLRALITDEHALIGGITADSFVDDPINLWVFKNRAAMSLVFTALAKHVMLPRGFGHVSQDECSGTLWLPPGASHDLPIAPTIALAPQLLRAGGIKAVQRSLKIDSSLARIRPEELHYYLFSIAVHPDHQGRGQGKALMVEGLKAADKSNMPVYLESSKESNIGFYQNFGFEVLAEHKVSADSPPMWPMWRKPIA